MSEHLGSTDSTCTCDARTVVFRITIPITDELGEKLELCGTELLEGFQADRVLIDLNGSSSFSPKSRVRWVKFLKHPRIVRTAIFGGSPVVRMLARIMIKLSQKENIAYFESEEEARDWVVG